MKKGNYKIPFHPLTNEMQSYPQDCYRNENWFKPNWVDNYIFEDTFSFDGFGRGRSSATFYVKSKIDGRRYEIFMKDMLFIITNTVINYGTFSGKFTFVKRGSNYGLTMIVDKV